jgi:hypothetical protein
VNTRAWVKATTTLDALGGSETKIPGVNKKKRTNVYKNMKKFMVLYKHYIKIKITKVNCIYGKTSNLILY